MRILLLLGLLVVSACSKNEFKERRNFLEKSVVLIRNVSFGSLGTGFLIENRGRTLVITAGHVCKEPLAFIMAEHERTRQRYIIKPAYVNLDTDICINTVIPSAFADLGRLSLADRRVEIGDMVYTLGYPFGEFLRLGNGSVESVNNFIANSMYAVPGQSGSPLVNTENEVIGILVQTNLMLVQAYSTPVRHLKDVLKNFY